MRKQLNVAKSMGGDEFMPTATLTFVDDYDGESANDVEGRLKGCRLVCSGVLVCHGRIVLCFP